MPFLSESLSPDKRLDQMLVGNSASRSATKELDKMYMVVLEDLLQKGHGEDNEDMGRPFQQIVGSIVTLFETQEETTLTTLLAVSSAKMKKILGPLRFVLDIPDDQKSPIKLFHLSFRDFIVDKQSCLNLYSTSTRKTHMEFFLEAVLRSCGTNLGETVAILADQESLLVR